MDSDAAEGIGDGQVEEPHGAQQVVQGAQEQHSEAQAPVRGVRDDQGVADGIGDGQVKDIRQVYTRGLRDDQGARVYPRKLCNPTYITRLSTMRFIKTARKFSEIQKGHVRKYKMEALLHMPYHLSIPMNLLEWLDQHIGGTIPRFRHKDKVIEITKDMVDKIFDFPGGTVPFVFSSDDPQVKAQVVELRSKYTDHRNKIPINKIEEVMLADESEEGFMRSFAFYFLASILCPASYCYASSKYLFSLIDVSAIPTLDFGSLGLEFMLEESERHSEMIFNRETLEEMNKPSHIGGCLPIWGIIYLDFVDFDDIPLHQSTVDYSLPRISHIKNEDFQYLALVDRNYQSRKAFGVLPLRHISQTPYATTVPLDNASDEPDFSHLVSETEANNNNEVPFLNTAINLNNQQSNTAEPEVDVKVKTDNHVKSEDKLLVRPEVFDPISCQREFNRINSEESIWKDDLLFFPTINNTHWVLCCINSLFERTHFFDPCGTTQDNVQQEIIHNLVSNFNLLAKLSKKPFKNVFTFKLQSTGPYPTNCLMPLYPFVPGQF